MHLSPAQASVTDSLQPDVWQPLLTTSALGRGDIRYEYETDSTNLQLRGMAQSGAPHGSVCLCEMQTAGRGRLGRSWHSPAGCGLWCSVLLRPTLQPEDAPLITLCTALAMQRAILASTGVETRIKWPNDLVHNGKKLCGVLLEVSCEVGKLHHVVVGTGVNVHAGAYPRELAHQATALCEAVDHPSRARLLAAYLRALEDVIRQLEQEGFSAILPEYEAVSCTLGQRVRVSGGMELTGFAEKLDDTGALLVRDDDGQLHRVLAGDVSVRGVMGYV